MVPKVEVKYVVKEISDGC